MMSVSLNIINVQVFVEHDAETFPYVVCRVKAHTVKIPPDLLRRRIVVRQADIVHITL